MLVKLNSIVKLLLLVTLSASAFGAASRVVQEADAISQNGRPVVVMQPFTCGEIAHFAQPQISGQSITKWQVVEKTRCGDGSLRTARITYIQPTIAANTGYTLTFVDNVASHSTGSGLTQPQMIAFNSGNWGGQIVITPSTGSPVTTDAATLLADNDPRANAYGAGLNELFSDGPVETCVTLQDVTSASKWAFGWAWNGTTMGTAAATPSSATASLNPRFNACFYPDINQVMIEPILENMGSSRLQGQNVAITLKTGNPATTVYSKATYLMLPKTRWHKIFWTGGASSPYTNTPTFWIGHIRLSVNAPYMKTAGFIPNYDTSIAVGSTAYSALWATSYSNYTSSKCDIGETACLNETDVTFADNSEGAPVQRPFLLLLYNEGSIATVNGEFAKSLVMATGEVDANPSNTLVGCTGGGCGAFNYPNNVPYHVRETRTTPNGQQSVTNYFYCDGFAGKNSAGNNSTCGAVVTDVTNTATGKFLSRYAHSNDQWNGSNCGQDSCTNVSVGNFNTSPWDLDFPTPAHWQDFSYEAYLYTGDPYYMEEEQAAASWLVNGFQPDAAFYNSNGIFGFCSSHGGLRPTAWCMQVLEKAAAISPDNTTSKSYYTAMLNSQLEILYGAQQIATSSLTPASTNNTCTSYDYRSANRYDWGHCSFASECLNTGTTCSPILTSPLHMAVGGPGNCPADPTFQVTAVSNTATAIYHFAWLTLVLNQANAAGFTQAKDLRDDVGKMLLELIGDSTANPYNLALYNAPIQNGAALDCSGQFSLDPFMPTWANWELGVVSAARTYSTFDPDPGKSQGLPLGFFPCTDHNYAISARAAVSTLVADGVSSSDVNCPSGTCTASNAYSWLDTHVPYGTKVVTGSTSCSDYEEGIKYSIVPTGASPTVTACLSLSPSSATKNVGDTQAYSGSCTFSDSSTGACPELILSSTNTGVATVLSTIATAVGAGSSTISATDNGHACGNTSALTVNAAPAGNRVMKHTLGGGRIIR